jgi:uncharacterized phage-associated protein
MAQAIDVANWFINNNSDISKSDLDGHLKLQKLLYYSQAMHLVINEQQPLFNSRIEAWEKGPVVPSIYRLYTHHELVRDALMDSNYLFNINGTQRKILEIVNHVYGDLSSDELVEQTHLEDPWAKKEDLAMIRANPPFSNDELFNYYKYLADLYEAYSETDFETYKTISIDGIKFSYEGELELTGDEREGLSSYKDEASSTYFIYRDENGELVVY